MAHPKNVTFVALNLTVMSVSDSRTLGNDTSGQLLVDTACGEHS